MFNLITLKLPNINSKYLVESLKIPRYFISCSVLKILAFGSIENHFSRIKYFFSIFQSSIVFYEFEYIPTTDNFTIYSIRLTHK